jgi:hypothetical protein
LKAGAINAAWMKLAKSIPEQFSGRFGFVPRGNLVCRVYFQ